MPSHSNQPRGRFGRSFCLLSASIGTAAFTLLLQSAPASAITVIHPTNADWGTGTLQGVVTTTANALQLASSSDYDKSDPNLKLLLEMEGTNGSTTFVDSSTSSKSVAANGSAQISTARSEYGVSSGLFNGSTDYVTSSYSTDWEFGSGNFTVDWWEYQTAATAAATAGKAAISRDSTTSWSPFIFGYSDGTNLLIYMCSAAGCNSTWDISNGQSLGPITLNTWNHFAVTRSGNTFYGFKNGILQSSWTLGSTLSINANANPLSIGKYAGLYFFQGNMDNVRVTKGRALWTQSFTPPVKTDTGVFTSAVIDAGSALFQWQTIQWTVAGVETGNGESAASSTGLVAQWDFDQTSGISAPVPTGSCGGSCEGTLTGFANTTGPDLVTGSGWTNMNKKFGDGALMFDGVNDYVSSADNAAFNVGTGDYSIEFWMRDVVNPAGQVYPVAQANAAGANADWGFYVYVSSAGKVSNAFCSGSTCYESGPSVATVTGGQWHHVAGVRSGTTMAVYVDGELSKSTVLGSLYTVNNPTGILAIGRGGGTNSGYYNGTLDAVRLYSRALSASEILSNYQIGSIQVQTRTGNTADPNADGAVWDVWKPSGSPNETPLLSMDNDAANWSWDTTDGTTIPTATSSEANIKVEGAGSLKMSFGAVAPEIHVKGKWDFEETTGTGAYLKDTSTLGNDATPSGTTVVAGVFGKARSFNGTSDAINYGSASSLALFGNTSYSVQGWVYRNGSATTEYVYAKAPAANNAGLLFWVGTDGSVFGRVFMTTTNAQSISAASLVPVGRWTHVAMVFNENADNKIKIYVDGSSASLTSQTAGVGSIPDDRSAAAYSGRDPRDNISYGLNGKLDELLVTNTFLSAVQIAESYRMGRDHTLSRTISSTDLTAKNKIPFYIAADRTGTYLQSTIGENAFVNYLPDANTVGFWHFDEKNDNIANYLKDASAGGHDMTPSGSTSSTGVLGQARSVSGGSYVYPTSGGTFFTYPSLTVDFWVNPGATQVALSDIIDNNHGSTNNWTIQSDGVANSNKYYFHAINATTDNIALATLTPNVWQHVAYTWDNSTHVVKAYVNGGLVDSHTGSGSINYSGQNLKIGKHYSIADRYFNGLLDEMRLSNIARSASDIRAAYEFGRRSHPITINFAAKLDSANLIANSSDLSFTVDGTGLGLAQKASNLYPGDQIIIKENVNGTEYVATGTVDTVNASTGAITVTAWNTGSTFPSSTSPAGFTANATVMKWQREYWDISDIEVGSGFGDDVNQKDAITNMTFRVTDASQGATVYLDDMEAVTSYLSVPTSTNNITSNNNQYFQYRVIFTSSDNAAPSPALSQVLISYQMLNPVPTLSSFSPTSTFQALTGPQTVHLIGTNFISGSTVSVNGISHIPAFNSATDLTITLDNTDLAVATSSLAVFVTNPAPGGGNSGTLGLAVTPQLSAPIVSTNPATDLADTSVTLNGNITDIGNDPVTARGFAYGLTTAYGTTSTESGSFNTGTFSTSTTGLVPDTTYHFRAYAQNTQGVSYGSDQTFTTNQTARTLSIDTNSYSATYAYTDTPPTITATPSAGSGLGSITFNALTPSICTINTNTGLIAFVSAGTCSFSATIASNGGYSSATSPSKSFEITASGANTAPDYAQTVVSPNAVIVKRITPEAGRISDTQITSDGYAEFNVVWTPSAQYVSGTQIALFVNPSPSSTASVQNCTVPTTQFDQTGDEGVGSFTSFNGNEAIFTLTTSTAPTPVQGRLCIAAPVGRGTRGVFFVAIHVSGDVPDFGDPPFYINAGNDVDISGNIPATLSFSITDPADLDTQRHVCNLGTLTPFVTSTCSYRLRVQTNAQAGFVINTQADKPLSTGYATMTNAVANTIPSGTEEAYGFQAMTAPQSGGRNPDTFQYDQPLSLLNSFNQSWMPVPIQSATSIAESSHAFVATTTDQALLVIHAAYINAGTPAGNYNQTMTYTVTARF